MIAEDHAIGLIKYENRRYCTVLKLAGRFRGGMDLRDEVMGTEGTIWIKQFFYVQEWKCLQTGKGADYVAEKAESKQWLVISCW